MIRTLLLAAVLGPSVACTPRAAKEKERPSPSALRETSTAADVTPTTVAGASAGLHPTPSAAPARGAPPAVAGDVCRLSRSPMQLPFTGPATLWPDDAPGHDPHLVFNRDGVPHVVRFPAPGPTAPKKALAAKVAGDKAKDHVPTDASAMVLGDTPPERVPLGSVAQAATAPGCVVGGAYLFCADNHGAIHRLTLEGSPEVVVAKSRPGTPIAAATIAGSHVVYTFLGDRKTTEGFTTIAFVGYDDATPATLSEDGSGATFATLAPRGDDVVAMYIDARRALTPVHARVLKAGARLTLGPDAVVFVGDGADARVAGALAHDLSGGAFALVPNSKGIRDYGLAAIRIHEQPRDDAEVVWSMYPAGLDGPVVAATHGVSPVYVLRSRPTGATPGGKQALELGEIDGAGRWKPLCVVGESAGYRDPAIVVDREGAVWISYTDAEGTWIERRGG